VPELQQDTDGEERDEDQAAEAYKGKGYVTRVKWVVSDQRDRVEWRCTSENGRDNDIIHSIPISRVRR